VIGAGTGTTVIADGDWIIVDGDAATVHVVQRANTRW
jgi:hypothetical protein